MNILLQMHHPAALEGAATAAAAALVAGLWQGVTLALITALFLKFLPGTTATARFILWSAVFAAAAAIPLIHLAASMQSPHPASPSLLQLAPGWSYALAGLWLAVAGVRLALLAVETVGLRHVWRTAEPLAEEVLQQTGLHSILLESRVEVCATSEVDRPSVIGFFAPRILIPTWLLPQVSQTELCHIVLHEMEHLRRRDDWVNLLQKIGLALFPLNPALFWIDRRLSTEREIACDDGVLARTKAPRAYASSLTSIAERRLGLKHHRRMVALALGAFGALGAGSLRRRSEFATRIESILGRRPSGGPAFAIVLVVGVIAGAAAMTQAPDLVSFGVADTGTRIARTTLPQPSSASFPQTAGATFQNASMRFSTPATVPHRRMVSHPHAAVSHQDAITTTAAIAISAKWSAHPPRVPLHRVANTQRPQWLVLTAYEESSPGGDAEQPHTGDTESGDVVVPVSRVVVRTPDGRFFVAPYAAVPTRAGWLIVQL